MTEEESLQVHFKMGWLTLWLTADSWDGKGIVSLSTTLFKMRQEIFFILMKFSLRSFLKKNLKNTLSISISYRDKNLRIP